MNKIRVLFISNIYEPQESGGTQRICQFFNALNSSAQHRVFLITTRHYPHHTTSTEQIYREHDLYKLSKAKTKNKSDSDNTATPEKKSRRLIKMIFYLIFCFPDESATFIPFGLYRAFILVCKHRMDYVFSTYPSASNLVIGWFISFVFGKKHIVDLREPWSDKPDWTMRYSKNILYLMRLRLEHYLESVILRNAHIVIMNHRWMSAEYKNLVSDESRLVVIPNGFDDKLIAKAAEFPGGKDSSDVLNLIYTGSYYLNHQPDFILQAIERMIEKEPRFKNKIKFSIYGSIDDKTRHLIEKYRPVCAIKCHSYIKKEAIFRKMLESDLGVISFPPTNWSINMIPSKIYEYKKLNVPLLIIGENESALQALAKEWGEPFFHAADTESIADFLIKFTTRTKSEPVASENGSAIDEYSYSLLTKRFLSLFK